MLDFYTLERRVADYDSVGAADLLSRSSRRLLVAIVISAITAFFSVRFLPDPWSMWVAVPALATELVAFALFSVTELRSAWRVFRESKAEFARSLDGRYDAYVNLVVWLRSHPASELRMRWRYLRDRRDVMQGRITLIVGEIARLGMFPLVAAVILQLSNYSSPVRIDGWKIYSALLLLLIYVGSWSIAMVKFRLDFYVRLFDDALDFDKPSDVMAHRTKGLAR